jgi:hypothetical protein
MKKQLGIISICASFFCGLFMLSCSNHSDQHNVISDQEKKEGWTLLFDGVSISGWHLFNRGNIPSAWSADSGSLVCNPHAKNIKHGDLVTDKVYENFDLVFDWKISQAGNSGLFINVQERPDLGTTFSTGPEYQLLDDKNSEEGYLKDPSHKAAAVFGVIPNNSKTLPTSGQWNHSRILQQNGKVSFWLNGVLTVRADFQSPEWKQSVAGSPMSHYPEFGKAIKGHLAVQDWTNGVSFRDIKIREL